MSTAAARARTTPAPAAAPAPRGSLRLVPPRSAARRAPFVAVVVALLAVGLLGLLALNTVLAHDAFRLHELQVEGKQLAEREQALLTEVESLQAPRSLADRAEGMGMVQGGPPSFLRLPDGAVLGEGAAGVVAPQPDLVGGSAVPPAPAAAEAQTEQAEQAEEQQQAEARTEGQAEQTEEQQQAEQAEEQQQTEQGTTAAGGTR